MPSCSRVDGFELTPADEVQQTAPVTAILESIPPLRHHLPDSAMIFTTFAGPGLLFAQLCDSFHSCGRANGADPDYVVDVILNMVRSALDWKADGIALIEQTVAAAPSELLRSHKTIRKLADFYDAGFLLFSLPVAEKQGPDLPAHCVFDLAPGEKDMGPVVGRLGPKTASNTVPVTTAGDVPATMTVDELKALLHEGRAA